jgi:hypothetical protein
MSPFVPTLEQIQTASSDLHYEWEQLAECRRLEDTFRVPELPGKVYFQNKEREKLYNLIITGFAIHTRNLLRFFYMPRKGDYNDIVVTDYFETPAKWMPPQIPDRDSDWVDKILSKANKRAAHLTYTRADRTFSEMYWDFDQIFEYLSILWQHFNATASPRLFIPNLGD